MASVYALPVAAGRRSGAPEPAGGSTRKRKRKLKLHKDSQPTEPEIGRPQASVEEYTAVLTPEERSQRRLAGQPLSSNPPSFPFPHASTPTTTQADDGRGAKPIEEVQIKERGDKFGSLRLQHLACLTAVLHRSLLNRDFQRAGRALGLMLRDEIGGQPVDVRSTGHWAVGAEILLRQHSSSSSTSISTSKGFQDAKDYYEKLIVQYPYHKSWPEATNSVDFYLSMFNLWIYVVHEESLEAARATSREGSPPSLDGSPPTRREASRRTLAAANEIADRMDQCMSSVPYIDNTELMRLRAAVALWQADLNQDCQKATVRDGHDVDGGLLPTQTSTGSDHSAMDQYARQENAARATAQRLRQKLHGHADRAEWVVPTPSPPPIAGA